MSKEHPTLILSLTFLEGVRNPIEFLLFLQRSFPLEVNNDAAQFRYI